jgi:integrase
MKEVPDRNRLELRNGVWQYRRRVPADLGRSFGKPMVRQSLNTGSIKEAQKRRNILDVEYDARFAALRLENAGTETTPSPARITKANTRAPLSREEVKQIIADHVARETAKFERSILARPAEDSEEKAALEWEQAKIIDVLGQPENPLQHELIADTYETLFKGRQFGGVSSTEAAELVRRGLIEIIRHETRILSDDFPLFAPEPRAGVPPTSQTTFGEVAREYLNDEIEKATVNRRRPQWIDKVTAHVEFLIEFVGEHVPIVRVDYDEAKRLQSALARMPSNRRKKYPKLTIQRAIEQAQKDKVRLLSPISQSRYLDFFRGIMALATAKRLVPSNPALGLRPIKQDVLSASEKRPPFAVEQIAEIFDSGFYRQWVPGASAPYEKADRDWRFWLPLLLAFSGMRPGEACQMLTADIHQSPNGHWYAKLIETDDESDDTADKSLKTTFSRRNVPIHPELLEIGFLQFVQIRKKDKADQRLFKGMKKGPRGYFSDYPCRRFREHFLPKMVELQPRQTVYSFRHSFRDALRRIKAPVDVVSALGGWSEGSRVSDAYGSKNGPDYLFDYIEQVSYPGTKLNFCYFPLI